MLELVAGVKKEVVEDLTDSTMHLRTPTTLQASCGKPDTHSSTAVVSTLTLPSLRKSVKNIQKQHLSYVIMISVIIIITIPTVLMRHHYSISRICLTSISSNVEFSDDVSCLQRLVFRPAISINTRRFSSSLNAFHIEVSVKLGHALARLLAKTECAQKRIER